MLGDEASLPSLAKDVLQEEPGKNDAATAVKWMLDAHGDSIDDNMTLATVSLNPA